MEEIHKDLKECRVCGKGLREQRQGARWYGCDSCGSWVIDQCEGYNGKIDGNKYWKCGMCIKYTNTRRCRVTY